MMYEFKDFALFVAKSAGYLLKDRFSEKHTIDYKGEIDIVTEADRMSEQLIVSGIRSNFSDHDILTEESPGINTGSDYRWIIDPLDGTTNYAHGYPVYCVSLALEVKGEIRLGIIYNPMMEEMFVAEKGAGAYLNDRPISVSTVQDLKKSLLSTGFPYDINQDNNNNINNFSRMAGSAQAIRRAGSAALDMAYVAAGRFDGFWELKLKPWDTAAGLLMIREAGGMVTDITGSEYHLESPTILASNGRIHQAMVEVLRGS